MKNKVRIIGGKFKRRMIEFLNEPSLRPTPDRIRETVFNWLAPYIEAARCLDAFSGSGALGFEALSRGAASVCFVDNNIKIIATITATAEKIDIQNFEARTLELPQGLHQLTPPFDIVFIDPPYQTPLLEPTLAALDQQNLLSPGALIYIEECSKLTIDITPPYELYKSGHTKMISYRLLRYTK